MTKPQAAAVQHKYSTRKQKAALDALISESESRSQAPSPNPGGPSKSYAGGAGARTRSRSITSSPMAPVLAGINLLALSHVGTETEHTLLALSSALEKVESEMEGDEEESDGEMEMEGEVEESMCSKIPFVEMTVEEAKRVDRASLRVLLWWIGEVVVAFGEELDVRSGGGGEQEDRRL